MIKTNHKRLFWSAVASATIHLAGSQLEGSGSSLIQASSLPPVALLSARLIRQSHTDIQGRPIESVLAVSSAHEEKEFITPSMSSSGSHKPVGMNKYVSAKMLTVQPYALGQIELDPPEGFPPQHSGKIRIELWISETGTVDLVRIDDSFLLPKHREHIKQQFARSRFHPGKLDSEPVSSFVEIEVLIRSEIDDASKQVPSVKERIPPPSSEQLPRE